jgi:methionine sulfoxide reductase heme-binding subunit
MAGAFLASVALGVAVLSVFGAGHKGTIIALQMTARWSYCFFLPAYVGGALTSVFGAMFQPLARRARDLGLAFASAHLTHLSLVGWLYYISPRPPVSAATAIYFGIAAILVYVLALFSIPTLAARLPPRVWWWLRTLAMEYIALAFLRDFLHQPFHQGLAHLLAYLPFIGLAGAAALLRIAFYSKRLHQRRLAPQAAH